MREDSGPMLGIFLTGLVVGLALGLIIAPQSGDETREMLREKGEILKERAESLKEKADEMAGSIKQRFTNRMGNYMQQPCEET